MSEIFKNWFSNVMKRVSFSPEQTTPNTEASFLIRLVSKDEEIDALGHSLRQRARGRGKPWIAKSFTVQSEAGGSRWTPEAVVKDTACI